MTSPTRPRALFVSHQASLTGAPMMLLHLLRWLREHAELDLEVLLLRRGPLERAFAEVATVHHLHRTPAGSILDRLEQVSYRLRLGAIGGRVRGLRHRYRLRRLGRFDLLYLNAALSFSMVRYFPRSSRRAVIGHLHELEIGIAASMPRGRPLQQLLPLVHRVIVCSDTVGSHVLERFDLPRGVRRHYEFIDVPKLAEPADVERARRELGLPEDALVVGNVATVEWRKGPDLFVQLAARLRRQLPDRQVVFVWVGATGAERDHRFVDHDARHAGVDDVIWWVPPVHDVRPFHAMFDVLALTSREDPFPLVCLEAAAQATPAVAFEGGGGTHEFLLPDCGVIVPYIDVAAMADAVAALLEDDEARTSLGSRAMYRVRLEHDVHVIAPQIYDDILSLLAEAETAGR